MSDSEKKYWTDDDELVEQYVLGKISEEERRRLEAEIADCEPCRAKLREEMEMAAGIRRHGRDLMKSQLRTKLRRSGASQFSTYQYVGLAAAVVVVALGIGLYRIFFSDLTAPKQFHQQEIVLLPEEDSSAGLQNESDALLPNEETPPEPLPSDEELAAEDQFAAKESVPAEIAEVVSTPSTTPQPEAASADASIAETRRPAAAAIAESENPSAMWLIGKVVMVPDRPAVREEIPAGATAAQISARRSTAESSDKKISPRSLLTLRRPLDEGIRLQQRAIQNLSAEESPFASAEEQFVHTLLEKTDEGVSLTLFGNAVTEQDLAEAVVETLTDDSLVVRLPSQRIAFRLPLGWNSPSLPHR